jgi:hypothetical protein
VIDLHGGSAFTRHLTPVEPRYLKSRTTVSPASQVSPYRDFRNHLVEWHIRSERAR